MRNLKTVSRKQDVKLKHQGRHFNLIMIQGADGRINCYRCSGCHTSCQTTGKWQRYNWIVILKEISNVVSVFVAAKPLLL